MGLDAVAQGFELLTREVLVDRLDLLQHHHIRRVLTRQLERGLAVGGGKHGEALVLEIAAHQIAQALLVVDNQNCGGGCAHGCLLALVKPERVADDRAL